ncbi:PadR family transcriptional regulator [Paractinoplanes atraurantiacus]|uniref:Virulence activator alpha C-term n=1 Tax=Paractinoplanes atraurantiacus TaxID=1036182 RepID=A0A285GR86_9ACTN|nr:PadR family transcriptional regulator [Actinoplanes atraurantiacus]SNY26049.1 Virulence activator alpha C-term [Actinoplanes atraurantiacus]
MPTPLPISAYVVLGLLRRHDGATPYELDQRIRQSIGYFWVFPRSQLYAEADRLVRRGLIAERQENDGRRRRTLSLTAEGHDELHRWLATPTGAVMEIHDEGLLRLFFQDPGDAGAATSMTRLAQEQIEAHEGRLAEYDELVASGRLRPGSPQRATLEVGLRLQRMMIGFWREVAAEPPHEL